MQKKLYYLKRYAKCGAMPLFLLLLQDKYGHPSHSILLCSFRNLKRLLRLRKGIENPKDFGRVLYSGYGEEPNETLRSIIKEKYDFDIRTSITHDARTFY